jgi:NAD(P)-dependent dehydrogenase (short-subunit alcohol dehydrogenase family)/acyl carrier protein
VVDVGPAAGFAVGDEVVVHGRGTLRRRVTVPSAEVTRKPVGLGWAEAVAKGTVYSPDELDEAFGELGRGADRVVVDLSGELPCPTPDIPVDGAHTYLITGGLGALGLVSATRLVDLGARHIALVGRRATPAPDVAHLLTALTARANVVVHQGDIANRADVERIMAAHRDGPPIGGILHTAGTLADAPVGAQTWESIDAVLGAKVYGTWLLHEATASLPDLKFFVGYSSAASVVGGVTQSNYAAANAYLDALLRWRADQGLPGLSINWGPWTEVGMSARLSEQVLRAWQDQGIRLFTPARGMRALVSLLGRQIGQVVAGECDWDRFTAAKPVANALYARLISDGGRTERAVDLDALQAMPRADRTELIGVLVRGKVADVLHFDDVDAVDPDVEFVRLGLDSLVAMELRNILEATFRTPLPPSVAFDHPSAGQLAEFLDDQIAPDRMATR